MARFKSGDLHLESGKNIKVGGENPYRTLILAAEGGITPILNGCSVQQLVAIGSAGTLNHYVFRDFDYTNNENLEWETVMPASYDGGLLDVTVIWTANSSSTNFVKWGFQAFCLADGDALGQAWGTAITQSDAHSGTAYTNNVCHFTNALTIANSPVGGSVVRFRLYRDTSVGSNLTLDARFRKVILKYGLKQYSD